VLVLLVHQVETTSDVRKLVREKFTYILGPLRHIWHAHALEPVRASFPEITSGRLGHFVRIVPFVPSDEPAGV
jgi:hypothetical protein